MLKSATYPIFVKYFYEDLHLDYIKIPYRLHKTLLFSPWFYIRILFHMQIYKFMLESTQLFKYYTYKTSAYENLNIKWEFCTDKQNFGTSISVRSFTSILATFICTLRFVSLSHILWAKTLAWFLERRLPLMYI